MEGICSGNGLPSPPTDSIWATWWLFGGKGGILSELKWFYYLDHSKMHDWLIDWTALHSGVYDTCAQRSHTHPFNGPFPGLPRWAGTRKVKPIWILLKQETVSGSGISWAICKSAPRTRQITTPATHHSIFTGRMPFLPPNQQRQSTEGSCAQRYAHNYEHFVNLCLVTVVVFVCFFKV